MQKLSRSFVSLIIADEIDLQNPTHCIVRLLKTLKDQINLCYSNRILYLYRSLVELQCLSNDALLTLPYLQGQRISDWLKKKKKNLFV